jgi:CRP-like cAMP-binding protein
MAELTELHEVFTGLDFVDSLGSKLLQMQFCRYLRAMHVEAGGVLFSEGDVGDSFYIVLHGRVEYTVKGGAIQLQSGTGDSFGQQGLHGENLGRRDATVVALEDTQLAVLDRADYLRITGALEVAVCEVLEQAAANRTLLQLKLVRALFLDTGFFRQLHFALLHKMCCATMELQTFGANKTICRQGQLGTEFFILIRGQIDVWIRPAAAADGKVEEAAYAGPLGGLVEARIPDDEAAQISALGKDKAPEGSEFIRRMDAGVAFGELALLGATEQDRRRTATLRSCSDGQSKLAALSRESYLQITDCLERAVYKALATVSEDRTDKQVELLFEFFEVLEATRMHTYTSVLTQSARRTSHSSRTCSSMACEVCPGVRCVCARACSLYRAGACSLLMLGRRRQCCRAFVMQRVAAGEAIYAQGEEATCFHVVVRGSCRVEVDGEKQRSLAAGASMGELELLLGDNGEEAKGQAHEAHRGSGQLRGSSVFAETDCLLATMTFEDFVQCHNLKQVQHWINKFWVLLTSTIDQVKLAVLLSMGEPLCSCALVVWH